MKTNFCIPLVLAFSLALPLVPRAENNQPANPPPAAPSGPTEPWADLKGYTFDQRELLFAGLKGLEARVDAQIRELVAKRVVMVASNTSTRDWDFAMQEMESARNNLLSTSDDLTKSTRATWNQQKDKVGLAWVWTQNAFAKVKASTTS